MGVGYRSKLVRGWLQGAPLGRWGCVYFLVDLGFAAWVSVIGLKIIGRAGGDRSKMG